MLRSRPRPTLSAAGVVTLAAMLIATGLFAARRRVVRKPGKESGSPHRADLRRD